MLSLLKQQPTKVVAPIHQENERKSKEDRSCVASILNGRLGEKTRLLTAKLCGVSALLSAALKCYGGAQGASFLAPLLARSKLKYHMGESLCWLDHNMKPHSLHILTIIGPLAQHTLSCVCVSAAPKTNTKCWQLDKASAPPNNSSGRKPVIPRLHSTGLIFPCRNKKGSSWHRKIPCSWRVVDARGESTPRAWQSRCSHLRTAPIVAAHTLSTNWLWRRPSAFAACALRNETVFWPREESKSWLCISSTFLPKALLQKKTICFTAPVCIWLFVLTTCYWLVLFTNVCTWPLKTLFCPDLCTQMEISLTIYSLCVVKINWITHYVEGNFLIS